MEQTTEALRTSRAPLPLAATGAAALAIFLAFFMMHRQHEAGTDWGWLSILPTLLVLVTAIASRRPFESLLGGAFAGMVMLGGSDLVTPFAERLSGVMGDETIIWLVLVCGLMGGLITLLEMSGCLGSFSRWLQGRIRSERQALLTSVMIGLIVFIDDYLNCLAVSSSVKKLTDYYKVSREKLAYVIDSTAAPMCVIVPVSTWAVFFAGLLEENGLADKGQGMQLYISAIPYMLYGWIALIVVFLVAAGYIGNLGPMKAAEARAKAGRPIPEGYDGHEIGLEAEARRELAPGMGIFNFAFPMLLLILSTVYYEIDLLRGVMLTVAVTVGMYYVQGLLSFEKQMEGLFEGFKVMLYPLSTVIAGFLLKDVNDSLGMTEYVIHSIAPFMSQELLPALVFLVMAVVVFGTASSWGVFIIAIPIVVPIAGQVDANVPLVIGALLSAASFGSHACFFSDSTVLAAQGAGCSSMSHALTQIPYALIGGVASLLMFVALGYTLG